MSDCDTDDCCVFLGLALAIRRKRNPKKRLWMKEYLRKRCQFTRENLPNDPRLISRDDCINFFSMTEEAYDQLLEMITPKILKQDTPMRDAIPASQRLSITLRFLATGSSFVDLRLVSAISEHSIGRIVNETCEAIVEVLNDQIKTPATKEGWKKSVSEFSDRWNFPNCLGALDAKHVAIVKPSESSLSYLNHKKFYSIVLTAVVNSKYEFIIVDTSAKGRIPDGSVLRQTSIEKTYSTKALNLSNPSVLPMSGKKLPYVFVGDDTFQLSNNVMIPYSDETEVLTNQQRIFNYRLRRARRIAENAFGVLISRFGVLQRTISLAPEKVQTVVQACCYLHNFLLAKASNEYFPSGLVDRERLENGTILEGSWRTKKALPLLSLEKTTFLNSTTYSKLIRDTFCDYFNNEGQVRWQNKFVNNRLT